MVRLGQQGAGSGGRTCDGSVQGRINAEDAEIAEIAEKAG